jgi:hypothetical protein
MASAAATFRCLELLVQKKFVKLNAHKNTRNMIRIMSPSNPRGRAKPLEVCMLMASMRARDESDG